MYHSAPSSAPTGGYSDVSTSGEFIFPIIPPLEINIFKKSGFNNNFIFSRGAAFWAFRENIQILGDTSSGQSNFMVGCYNIFPQNRLFAATRASHTYTLLTPSHSSWLWLRSCYIIMYNTSQSLHTLQCISRGILFVDMKQLSTKLSGIHLGYKKPFHSSHNGFSLQNIQLWAEKDQAISAFAKFNWTI